MPAVIVPFVMVSARSCISMTGVRNTPGQIMFTLMCAPANSMASALVNPQMPASVGP
jgi:hypothetical protein